jgi:hypothetical protein
VLLALAARKAGRPVKWVERWSLELELHSATQ